MSKDTKDKSYKDQPKTNNVHTNSLDINNIRTSLKK